MNLFSYNSVSIAFDGREVLSDFSLSISEGEKVILRGASGSGKSTLLRLLLGFVQPDAGEVCFRSEPISPEVALQVRRSVAYVNQSVELGAGTVADALDRFFSIKAFGGLPEKRDQVEAMDRVRLSKKVLTQSIQQLSGGERHRIGIAIGFLMKRSIFLLDEPTAALDAALKSEIADLFLENPKWTLIASAHDSAWYEGRAVTLIDLSYE